MDHTYMNNKPFRIFVEMCLKIQTNLEENGANNEQMYYMQLSGSALGLRTSPSLLLRSI